MYPKNPPPPDKNPPSKTAILYICTGHYSLFWEGFFKSTEQHFFFAHERHYFVFTDDEQIHKDYAPHERVHVIKQEKLGWPRDTLMRFHLFSRVENELQSFDYIYFCNANTRFVRTIGDEFLPDTKNGKTLVFVSHVDACNRAIFMYDTNPQSRAYIAAHEGTFYVWGGLNGGTAGAYIAMINELKIAIDADLERDVIALWHDESHTNRYLVDHAQCAHVLSRFYATPYPFWNYYDSILSVNYITFIKDLHVLFLNKDLILHGGLARLRADDALHNTHRIALQKRINRFCYNYPHTRRIAWISYMGRILPCGDLRSIRKTFPIPGRPYIPIIGDLSAFILYVLSHFSIYYRIRGLYYRCYEMAGEQSNHPYPSKWYILRALLKLVKRKCLHNN